MEKDLDYLYRALIIEDYRASASYSFLSQLSVITSKSLLPSMTQVGLRIDYKRFIEELRLWLLYRTGYNQALENIDQVAYASYYGSKDESALARIIPLVVANQDFNLARQEIIKNILFTSGHIEGLFENLLMGEFFYHVYNGEPHIEDRLKQEVINFSQEDFLQEYANYYRLAPRNEKKFKIQIEMERIKLINYFNQIEIEGYEGLKELLAYYQEPDFIPIGLGARIFRTYKDKEYLNIDPFYLSLSSYLLKLRASRIEPENLEIKDYVLPDFFAYSQGDSLFHSLLGQCQVLERTENTMLIKSKSGYYNLKK